MKSIRFLLAPFVLSLAAISATAQIAIPAPIAAAVNDKDRPQSDTVRDIDRKPAELIVFSQMKAGDTVVDFIPGGGYNARMFSRLVGPGGHVYEILPEEYAASEPDTIARLKMLAADPAYRNVSVVTENISEFTAPESLDVVWSSKNCSDLVEVKANRDGLNKGIFNALKPGGIYLVIDSAANKGAGFSQAVALHRAEPEAVKAEILKAGFVFDGESKILANAKDDRTKPTRDPSVGEDKGDRFVFRFRKPR